MKANAPKRKIFDAVDMLTGETPAQERAEVADGIQMLPVENIKPFHDHPFRLYEGERLDDMVESIKEHGVLNPVIVWKKKSGYEMLAGHNRLNAAKIGLCLCDRDKSDPEVIFGTASKREGGGAF